jgi:SAM-dependent methyltransferase
MKVHKRYMLAHQIESIEALGQLGGSGNLEEDIALCPLQTINEYFLKYLPRQERILEAGAGRGRWVFHLRRQGYDIMGIDIAKSDIDFARKHDPTVSLSYDNVLHTSFPDGHFGAVISLGVVEHFEDGPEAAFSEVLRLLRPGGLFFVTVPTQNIGRRIVFNRVKDLQHLGRTLRGQKLAFEEYRYSRKQFRELLRRSGFEIIETAPDDFVPPKNMGLYTDSRLFQHPVRRWELNRLGSAINGVERSISPWLNCSGTLWVCRKPVA